MRPLPLILLLLATPTLAQDPAPAPASEPATTPAPAAEPAPAPPAVDPPPVAPDPPPPLAAEPAPPPAVDPAASAPPPTTGQAPAPTPSPVAEVVPAPATTPVEPYPRFGMRLGAGFPDGATADVVFRPMPWLRLQAGPAWNYLAWGFQGGVALTPIRWVISPVLEARYGHFFGANLNKVAKNLSAEVQSLATDVGYDYFNGQLALEFGSPRGFTFSLGVGLCYLWTDVNGTGTVVQNRGTPDQATVTIVNPSVRAVLPSVRLGMLYYF